MPLQKRISDLLRRQPCYGTKEVLDVRIFTTGGRRDVTAERLSKGMEIGQTWTNTPCWVSKQQDINGEQISLWFISVKSYSSQMGCLSRVVSYVNKQGKPFISSVFASTVASEEIGWKNRAELADERYFWGCLINPRSLPVIGKLWASAQLWVV